MLPQRKQGGLAVDYSKHTRPRTRAMMKQRLVFATSPANQRLADMPLEGPERRGMETTVVVKPTAKLRVDLQREFRDGLRRTQVQFPAADLIPDFLSRVVRDGRTETTEHSSPASGRLPGSERKAQEVELLVRVVLLPIRFLTVDELRLFRVQIQATLAQPIFDSCTYQGCFPPAPAVDDDVVRVALKRQMLPFLQHPQI